MKQANLKLHNFKNTYFTGPITLGDQEFQVIFDIGSANFWIPLNAKMKDANNIHNINPALDLSILVMH